MESHMYCDQQITANKTANTNNRVITIIVNNMMKNIKAHVAYITAIQAENKCCRVHK